ncbi:hypothetical protein KSK37_05780 [Kaistella sp. DKR-2]|uniref:hypothetical protein n=1 Tax=Kaistella soli TaxID=2849654 RepID=UPI001186AE69|nr:hypothetical protein [Kaistella soli]MBU8882592.1 hypothetical protein [Kaistella soli]
MSGITNTENAMETSKRNTPGPLVVASIIIVALVIISYFIIISFFPELFQAMPKGEAQPVK